MIALLSADRGTVKLIGKRWRDAFPTDRLASRIAFYKRLTARPRTGRFYAKTLKALEDVQRQIAQEN